MIEYKARNGQTRVKPQLGVDITLKDLDASCEGWCLACGSFGQPAKPNAYKYKCDDCGETTLYGLDELVAMGLVVY